MKNKESEKKPGGNQPKHHAPKTRMQSIMRRREIIEAALTGKSIKQAAIDSGLSPKTANDQATRILQEPQVQQAFNRILEQSGLSDEFLAKRLYGLCTAKTKVFAQKDGVFTDVREIDALETQRKTVELVCRLAGYLKQPDLGGTINNSGLMQIVISQLSSQEK